MHIKHIQYNGITKGVTQVTAMATHGIMTLLQPPFANLKHLNHHRVQAPLCKMGMNSSTDDDLTRTQAYLSLKTLCS